MSDEVIKKFLYVNRKAPYGTIYALESLEVILIGAAFDQDVSLAFIDDGVYQLKKNQTTTVASGIGVKDFSKTYRALEDYDIEKLYVDQRSMDERGLTADDLIVAVEVLDETQMAELMEQQDVVLSF
ncbi:MAG: sulfurtransferase TusC [Beggiatoa sp. IS2]|nr:MAG: sulfurtransferase TusC [Beggiatoa sp. IS2]